MSNLMCLNIEHGTTSKKKNKKQHVMPYDEKMPKEHLFWCVFPDRVDNKY